MLDKQPLTMNKVIKCKQYPLPIITDILQKRFGYKFFTKLGISMQYFTFELDEERQNLCTIITPFRKFKYTRLPMGLKCSPNIAQSVMENILVGIDAVESLSMMLEHLPHHGKTISLLDTILHCLCDNGFTVNPLKCEWSIQEMNWLGYWLTPHSLKPWKKKT